MSAFTLFPPEVGLKFHSRTGREYTITEVNGTGFKIGNAKVSKRLIERVRDQLVKGKEFHFQKNGPAGGISYTVAIEAGVAWALQDIMVADLARRVFTLRGDP